MRKRLVKTEDDPVHERDLEADLFAMFLMMPEEMVREAVKWEAPAGFDLVEEPAIKKLANKFRVTEQLMILRLVQLGFFEEILK